MTYAGHPPIRRHLLPPWRPRSDVPIFATPRFAVERETLKLAIQSPRLADDQMSDLELADFVHPTYALVWQAIWRPAA